MTRLKYLLCLCVFFGVCEVIHANVTVVRNQKDDEIVRECETPNGDIGLCIPFKQCSILLKQENNTDAKRFLQASQCGSSMNGTLSATSIMCCGKYDNYRIVKENKIFPKYCGRQEMVMDSRILGGDEAVLGEFPWMARLLYKNKYGNRTFGCSGFLINGRHVITAAHCVHSQIIGDKKLISVILGEHNTETNPDCTKGNICTTRHIRKIVKVVMHPGYNFKERINDIAIIQLNSGARRSEFVQPICVLRNDTQIPNRYYISGWGKTEKALESTIKMKLEVPPFNKAKCRQKMASLNIVIHDTQICAGGEGQKDSCVGDSGGPLMTVGDNETWYVAGIVSFGMDCGQNGWPGVYTNIVKYLPWIRAEVTHNMLRLKLKKKKKRRNKAKLGITLKPNV